MAILTEFDNINVENSHGVLFPYVLIFKFQKAKKTTFLGTRKIGWIFSRSTEIIIIIIIIFFSN